MKRGWLGAWRNPYFNFSYYLVLMTVIAKNDNPMLEPVFEVAFMKSGNRPIIGSYGRHRINTPLSK